MNWLARLWQWMTSKPDPTEEHYCNKCRKYTEHHRTKGCMVCHWAERQW